MNFIIDWVVGNKVKLIAGLIIAALVAGVVWKINQTFEENAQLHKELGETTQKLDTMTKIASNKQQTIDEIRARLAQVAAVDNQRKEEVKVEKAKSDNFSKETKKKALAIKEVDIESLDEYYATRYNTILDCIMSVTKEEPSEC